MTYKKAINAAERLAKSLRLTSRWGSVSVILSDCDYIIVIDADQKWRSKTSIPKTYDRFDVVEQDRTIGTAYTLSRI